jgi:hypothetical protein
MKKITRPRTKEPWAFAHVRKSAGSATPLQVLPSRRWKRRSIKMDSSKRPTTWERSPWTRAPLVKVANTPASTAFCQYESRKNKIPMAKAPSPTSAPATERPRKEKRV